MDQLQLDENLDLIEISVPAILIPRNPIFEKSFKLGRQKITLIRSLPKNDHHQISKSYLDEIHLLELGIFDNHGHLQPSILTKEQFILFSKFGNLDFEHNSSSPVILLVSDKNFPEEFSFLL